MAKIFRMDPQKRSDKQIHMMEELLRAFDHVLWKQRHLEDLKEIPWKTDIEELHQWDDYVRGNWNYAEEVKAEDY